MKGTRLLLFGLTAGVLSGCDNIFGAVTCTLEIRPNLVVEVREESGAPAALGVTGTATHVTTGESVELFATDSLTVRGHWQRELPGGYIVTVQKPGFRDGTAVTLVKADECHVETRRVPITLTRDDPAVSSHSTFH